MKHSKIKTIASYSQQVTLNAHSMQEFLDFQENVDNWMLEVSGMVYSNCELYQFLTNILCVVEQCISMDRKLAEYFYQNVGGDIYI